MALAALLRSAIKRQPRGLFTVSDPSRYQDGRRDLQLSIREHFVEQVDAYNAAVFSNGKRNAVTCGDVFDASQAAIWFTWTRPTSRSRTTTATSSATTSSKALPATEKARR